MRKHKWARRGAYFCLFLLALYLLFWWAFFNPLEGSVDRLDQMIPADVRYVVHGPWGKLREAELLRAILRGQFRGDVERALELEDYFYRPVREIEARVNENLPGILGTFSILEDVAGREVVVAGVLSGAGEELKERALNSPWLVLTRISFKARFMEVLKYDFVRDKIPNLLSYRDYYEYDVGPENIREGAPEEARFYYFSRIKDVLVLANDRELMEKTVRLALAGEGTEDTLDRNYWYYWDLGQLPQEPGLNLWGRVAQTDLDLEGGLEEPGRPPEGELRDFVRGLFPVALTTSLTLGLGVEGESTIPLSGAIRMAESQTRETLPDHLVGFHRREGEPLEPVVTHLASQIPLDRTFAFVWLKMEPRDFLLTFFNALDPATRELFFGEGDERGGAWSAERMASQVGDWFEEGVGLTWARLPEADEINLDTWDGGVPHPYPATTVFFKVKERLDPDDLIAFFEKNRERFGFEVPDEKPAATGRLFLLRQKVTQDLKLMKPAFAILDHEFVFSSNLGQLSRVLEAVAGKRKALAGGESFKAALGRVHEKGNCFAFIDVEKQRPYLLDQRWAWAFDETYFDAKAFRKDVVIRLNREHGDWSTRKINDEADVEVERRVRDRQDFEFPEAVQRYKDRMFWYEPFQWVALSMSVSGDTASQKMEVKGAIRLTSAEAE
ncbi:MAG: hypothetical protein ACYS99_04005 [Planctomycetota bacterium]